jgi:hypothetical protein
MAGRSRSMTARQQRSAWLPGGDRPAQAFREQVIHVAGTAESRRQT